MKSLCDFYRNDNQFKDDPYPLTFFSGDAFNPSKESTVTKGSHMTPVLNEIGIDLACVGNHEFDFGAAHFAYLAKDCNFPWLLANMFDPELGSSQPMGRCQRTQMLQASNGLKVGVIGLVEEEWTQKINNSLPADLEYHDMKKVAQELGPKLREQGADIVIVLSHARQERDFEFCENLPEGTVDIVLGGHDHWVEHQKFANGVHFVRSGYDFKNLSYITAFRDDSKQKWDFTVTRRNLNGDIPEDGSLKKLQEETVAQIQSKLEDEVGSTAVPLEARKEKCQVQETNYGNFLADLMRLSQDADCALINGGTFAGDQIYPSGRMKLKDIVNCFPFEDPIVVMKVSGQAIRDALENGVSKFPEQDSCFPHVSNIRFSFDPDAAVGNRVREISLGGNDLDLDKEYTMATRSHLAAGKCKFDLRGNHGGARIFADVLQAAMRASKAERMAAPPSKSSTTRTAFSSQRCSANTSRLFQWREFSRASRTNITTIGMTFWISCGADLRTTAMRNEKRCWRSVHSSGGEGWQAKTQTLKPRCIRILASCFQAGPTASLRRSRGESGRCQRMSLRRRVIRRGSPRVMNTQSRLKSRRSRKQRL